jgi:hypothetical protein
MRLSWHGREEKGLSPFGQDTRQVQRSAETFSSIDHEKWNGALIEVEAE